MSYHKLLEQVKEHTRLAYFRQHAQSLTCIITTSTIQLLLLDKATQIANHYHLTRPRLFCGSLPLFGFMTWGT
jgi:hypothetical protein